MYTLGKSVELCNSAMLTWTIYNVILLNFSLSQTQDPEELTQKEGIIFSTS